MAEQVEAAAVARKQAVLDAGYYTSKMKTLKDKVEKSGGAAREDPVFVDKQQRNQIK